MNRAWLSAAIVFVVVCVFLGNAAGARAEEIFSTFSNGDGFLPDAGWTIGGAPLHQGVAAQFSPSATGALDALELALGYAQGLNVVEVQLRADAADSPGAVIESFLLGGLPEDSSKLMAAVSAAHPVLSEGESYWVVVFAADAGSTALWNDPLTPVDGLSAVTFDGGVHWTYAVGLPAFRVEMLLVPEPSGFVLLGAGAAGLILGVWRRRFSWYNGVHERR